MLIQSYRVSWGEQANPNETTALPLMLGFISFTPTYRSGDAVLDGRAAMRLAMTAVGWSDSADFPLPSLRGMECRSNPVQRQLDLDAEQFGEVFAVWKSRLYRLTSYDGTITQCKHLN